MNSYVTCKVSTNAIITFGDSLLLVQIWPSNKKNEWKWGFAWWKVDKWESFHDCLKREIKEETWIKHTEYSFEKKGILQNKPNQTCKHIYFVKLKYKIEKFSYNTEEISDVKWFNVKTLPNNTNFYRSSWVYEIIKSTFK